MLNEYLEIFCENISKKMYVHVLLYGFIVKDQKQKVG